MWEGVPLALDDCLLPCFWQESSPRLLEEHTQVCPAHGAKRLVLLVWGKLVTALRMGYGALGSMSVECLSPQLRCHAREKAGQATGNTVEAAWHMASSRLQEGGWVPAAKQESKWKTMTYRKLCETRLVAEGYR